jgi:hypothetical protein
MEKITPFFGVLLSCGGRGTIMHAFFAKKIGKFTLELIFWM